MHVAVLYYVFLFFGGINIANQRIDSCSQDRRLAITKLEDRGPGISRDCNDPTRTQQVISARSWKNLR